jgi:hypothetical protein
MFSTYHFPGYTGLGSWIDLLKLHNPIAERFAFLRPALSSNWPPKQARLDIKRNIELENLIQSLVTTSPREPWCDVNPRPEVYKGVVVGPLPTNTSTTSLAYRGRSVTVTMDEIPECYNFALKHACMRVHYYLQVVEGFALQQNTSFTTGVFNFYK